MNTGRLISNLLLLVFLASQVAIAQTTTGTILGTVSDSTSAVIPGTTVTIRNVETGISRTVSTDAAGRYRITQLGLGSYEVTAEAAGFQTVVRSGITLTVGREAVVDFALQVGAVAERITVTGEAPLVDATTSEVSQVVEGSTIREIPLSGRSFDELALLQPGVFITRESQATTSYGQTNRYISVAGSRANASVVLLDGTNINGLWNRGGGGLAGQQLGVDAIREFRLITSTASAEYGRSAGGVMNVVTLSGTNEFHGTLFEFVRNNAMDARKFTDFDADGRPPFKRNQFGANLGGPIVRDRTFFFGTWEGLRQRLSDSERTFVPTEEARKGILPTRTVTVNSAVKPYLALYPLPNGPEPAPRDGTAEFNYTSRQTADEDFYQIRIDHQLSGNHSLFGRYTFDESNIFESGSMALYPLTGRSRNQYLTLQYTAILSPTLLNTARIGYNRSLLEGDVTDKPALLRFEGPIANKALGSLGITGLASHGYGTTSTPYEIVRNLFEYSNDLTMARGSHSLKFGGLVARYRDKFEHYYPAASAYYSFRNLADFLQNTVSSARFGLPGSDPIGLWRQWLFGFYIQDDWRATDRLTFNMGFRYEPVTNPKNVNAAHKNLFPVAVIDTLRDTGFSWAKNAFAKNPSLKTLSPRFGFAWDVFGNGSTAVRGGFGITYEPVLAHYFTMNVNDPPANNALARQRPQHIPTFPNPLAGDPVIRSSDFAVQTAMAHHYGPAPQILQYSLTLQRELPMNTALMVGYVGSKGNHVQYSANVNIPWLKKDAAGRDFVPWIGGVPAPRRNPNLGIVNMGFGGGVSHYNALQMSLQKRPSYGLSYGLSYTWSRNIDMQTGQRNREQAQGGTATIQNPDCLACNRGLSDFHIGHVVSLNYSYDLPIGPNRALGGNLSGVAGKLLWGWQLVGVLKASSGLPTHPLISFDRVGNYAEGTSFSHQRPDLKPGYTHNDLVIKDAKWDGRGFLRYWDPNAFLLPPQGYFGTLGRNVMTGPGSATWDFSLIKKTSIGEGKELQFRAETFNVLNRVNLATQPNLTIFNNATGVPFSRAGEIRDVRDARQIQLGLKFTF